MTGPVGRVCLPGRVDLRIGACVPARGADESSVFPVRSETPGADPARGLGGSTQTGSSMHPATGIHADLIGMLQQSEEVFPHRAHTGAPPAPAD